MPAMTTMQSSLPGLAAAVGAAALAMTAFGATRRHYPGWAIWLRATWALALGVACAAMAPRWAASAAPAELLLLLWPLMCVWGVRRFHARMPLPGSSRMDLGVAMATTVVTLTGVFWSRDSGVDALAPAAAALASHLYAASLLCCGPSGRDGATLRVWALVLLGCGLLPVAWAMAAGDGVPGLTLRAQAAALAALLSAFVAMVLVGDRTERQLRDSRRRLRWLANIDSLTHVPNRRHFQELAAHVLAADVPGSAALVLFDVDHFKQVNDHHGHAAGDRALRLVARCVQDVLRTSDVPGRHGGDEFVLLLRHANTGEAMAVADRIVARVQAQARQARLPSLSLSFGIVHLRRHESLDDALRRADQALYEAKRQGRSRAVAASGDEGHPVFTDSQKLGLRAA
jgi:diguanylate cyclase